MGSTESFVDDRCPSVWQGPPHAILPVRRKAELRCEPTLLQTEGPLVTPLTPGPRDRPRSSFPSTRYEYLVTAPRLSGKIEPIRKHLLEKLFQAAEQEEREEAEHERQVSRRRDKFAKEVQGRNYFAEQIGQQTHHLAENAASFFPENRDLKHHDTAQVKNLSVHDRARQDETQQFGTLKDSRTRSVREFQRSNISNKQSQEKTTRHKNGEGSFTELPIFPAFLESMKDYVPAKSGAKGGDDLSSTNPGLSDSQIPQFREWARSPGAGYNQSEINRYNHRNVVENSHRDEDGGSGAGRRNCNDQMQVAESTIDPVKEPNFQHSKKPWQSSSDGSRARSRPESQVSFVESDSETLTYEHFKVQSRHEYQSGNPDLRSGLSYSHGHRDWQSTDHETFSRNCSVSTYSPCDDAGYPVRRQQSQNPRQRSPSASLASLSTKGNPSSEQSAQYKTRRFFLESLDASDSYSNSRFSTTTQGSEPTTTGTDSSSKFLVPNRTHVSSSKGPRVNSSTIFAGRGWISPHPLSRSSTQARSPPQSHIVLPSREYPHGATMTYQEWRDIQDYGMRVHRNISPTESIPLGVDSSADRRRRRFADGRSGPSQHQPSGSFQSHTIRSGDFTSHSEGHPGAEASRNKHSSSSRHGRGTTLSSETSTPSSRSRRHPRSTASSTRPSEQRFPTGQEGRKAYPDVPWREEDDLLRRDISPDDVSQSSTSRLYLQRYNGSPSDTGPRW